MEADTSSGEFAMEDFWDARRKVNATRAIYHQWEQLEKTGCINNFRIAAGLQDGVHEGFFFADSDGYKWLEAASLLLGSSNPPPGLAELVEHFITLLEAAQAEDGYLYTWNQTLFPDERWDNLLIDHELYCLGHLIEAGIAHHSATGDDRLLTLVLKSAALLVETFTDAPPLSTDGHEEIELALIRLSRHTGDSAYLELAARFLDRRGRIKAFGWQFIRQTLRMARKMRGVEKTRRRYYRSHPQTPPVHLPARNRHKVPFTTPLRFLAAALSGKFIQQHRPLERQDKPEGHAVRFTYLNRAAAMLVRDTQNDEVLKRFEKVWEHMVDRRMYVTGGIGSLPMVEGFGRDYELDPEVAYAETCAAIGALHWNRELFALTKQARYADLEEWQLYNAASVGMGLDGDTYLYNNPLACSGGIQRAAWYNVPCCPSNLSRLYASLEGSILLVEENSVYLTQYISGSYATLPGLGIAMRSGLPWQGTIHITFNAQPPVRARLNLRLPAWSGNPELRLNGEPMQARVSRGKHALRANAAGLDFENAAYLEVDREFQDGDLLELLLPMPLTFKKQDDRLPKCGGQVALTRGPLVYCLESIDNPGGVFGLKIRRDTLVPEIDRAILGGTVVINGMTRDGRGVRFIPYMLWGNRGKSSMNVFFDAD